MRFLTTAKNRMSTPSSAAVMAVDTGSGMSTDASRTAYPGEQDDRQQAEDDAEEVVPSAHAGAAFSQRPKVELDLLPAEEQIDEEQTPATAMICVPRPRALNLSIGPSFRSSSAEVSEDSYRRAPILQANRRAFARNGVGLRS